MSEAKANTRAVAVELPDELVKQIASELEINDESRIPRTLTIATVPAHFEGQLGRSTNLSAIIVP